MKNILITGIGHSGTRLIVDILGNHKDIHFPYEKINEVNEHEPLHKKF